MNTTVRAACASGLWPARRFAGHSVLLDARWMIVAVRGGNIDC